jgi:hypothetical protein
MDETRHLNLEHRIYSDRQELWVRYGRQTLQVIDAPLGTGGFAWLLRSASIMASNLAEEGMASNLVEDEKGEASY